MRWTQPSLRAVLCCHAIVLAIGSIILWIYRRSWTEGFLGGGVLMMLNISMLAFLWGGVLSKKAVATSATVIVCKYAILIIGLYALVRIQKAPLEAVFLGVTTLFVGILLAAVWAVTIKQSH